jgi:hypothetical protein
MKTGLVLGDLHSGSDFAPCPIGFITSGGSAHEPNQWQQYLNLGLADMIGNLPKLEFICFDGDLIDGEHPKDSGHFIWEIDPLVQAMAAIELVKPILRKLKKGGRVFMLEGSKYHVGVAGLWERALRELLGIKLEVKPWYQIGVDGITLDIAHRQSMATEYPIRVLEAEMKAAVIRAAESSDPLPYGIIRAHTHSEFLTASRGLRSACAVPAWQIQTHYAETSVSPNKLFSHWLGSVLVHVDAERVEQNRRPVWFTELLYAHPKPRREEL